MIEKVVTLMWLYLITVNTQREAGVDGTELSQETVITNCLSILSILSLLDHLLLALCSQVSALSSTSPHNHNRRSRRELTPA